MAEPALEGHSHAGTAAVRLRAVERAVVGGLGAAGIVVAVNQLFNFNFFAGVVFLDNRYLFLLAGCYLPAAFLAFPGWRRTRPGVPLVDWALAALAIGAAVWLAWHAQRIVAEGWEYSAPLVAIAMAALLWALILEALRRAGGTAIFWIVLLASLYPLVAEQMPSPLTALSVAASQAAAFHILSMESAFGIPMRAFGELVVGFIVFGIAMIHTGAGNFFNNLAFALVGRWRGGAAQVAVISSGLQGSITGSVISNVVTSGVVTIPLMKRTGFAAPTAAGIESVASTGGVLMPPVMGSTAFVMASFLGIPYAQIAVAAAIPALLFYFCLVVQIDGYAARHRIGTVDPGDIPRIQDTLRGGWPFVLVFAVLIYFLLAQNQEPLAPWYATALLLVINQLMPGRRMGLKALGAFVVDAARGLAELVAILLNVGLIVGAFAMTGLAGTLANDLVFIAGDRPLVLLAMGAVTSFIFGMGMTVTACYIFLAITLAPALVNAGLDPLAVHLFIMYWGMVSFITPPVALAAFTAASIGKTSPMRTGLEASRLGSAIYIVPFLFVLNPALILHGSTGDIATVVATALLGIVLIASALQGYLVGFGATRGNAPGILGRVLLGLSGLAFALPGGELTGVTHMQLVMLAVALCTASIALLRFMGGTVAADTSPRPA